jgi:DNA helicase HerA-like ATPase
MTRALRLAADLALPLRAVTEKIAFLGRSGSGKTYAAMKLAEEMHKVGAQFVALDPVGVWFALRLAADGKGKGLLIPVLGGLHGDLPLEAGAGAIVADLVIDRGVSAVLDVSQFESDADKARFARAFADRFFFRKKAAPSAIHIFIEECQEFAPQNPQREEAAMLHAFHKKSGRFTQVSDREEPESGGTSSDDGLPF